MKFIGLCIAASLLVGCAVAQDWDDLRVRFGMNPLSNFVQMPRTVADATSQGFKQETNCDGAANKFLGRRFVHRSGDRSIMLLYDVNGIIAGIQTNVPKSTGFPTAAHKKFHDMWVEEPNAHVLTAYFVDPSIVCTTGRSAAQLNNQGTGTGLYLQKGRANSNSGVNSLRIPKNEADMPSTAWSKGKCFVFMGQHYWYNMRKNMNCDDFMPYFLLYNGGKLDGFGFAMTANYNGEYYEHPTVSVAGSFFPFVPDCMHQPTHPQTFTTAHVYMYKRPWTKLCVF
ncbi:hypothetical protein BOX15_Mlig008351g1 [Macrostomum lignano]|uniref:Uncharacterized protein n=2 Tax=Macrostomum lignano TaxID=282301 RepID=A0A267EI90_9PLAT|nr:hypothetical protein BOX15_Mlig008351g1 [Macrostomum lignano]